ncbi:MAG: DNA-directed RNA polymerase subunit beta, partial [Planctomycetota bacterium]
EGQAEIDDIDHLGNRRLRTIDELACEELRKGFLKLRRTAQERMSMKDQEDMTPRSLVNSKSVTAAIDFFFGRGELSQVVDQTNPLSQLTHERRLSALGPGGLNRKRAGFEVRDVHISHYGRICPIETPEGTNIGLISSLAIYAQVDDYGFLVTPYRIISDGVVTDETVWLRADQENEANVAPADTEVKAGRLVKGPNMIARFRSDFKIVDPTKVDYMDVAPAQMVGISAGLIPFLEHDDANRALMGSNMQRQAVPLLVAEPPIVGTGMERVVAQNSSMVIRSKKAGTVKKVDATHIEVGNEAYDLKKYQGLNERTCLNQKPIVKPGDKVEAGQIIADGAATRDGELALGRNVLVGFMSFDGYNYEDAIIISEELVKKDTYTSIHIEDFDVEIRDTKMGPEEFTRDIPNVSEKALRNLDDFGIVQVGTYVRSGDILVGKVSPKSKTELTPEEKLLHAIFGRAGEDVKNDSLEVPSGIEGIVIDTQKFSRRASLSDDQRKEFEKELKDVEASGNLQIATVFEEFVSELETAAGTKLKDIEGNPLAAGQDPKFVAERASTFRINHILDQVKDETKKKDAKKAYNNGWSVVEQAIDARDRQLNSMKRGDELRSGVRQMVKVYVATKRVISVGDKMAGRHGNKGVIAKILPVEDMPFLPDGTPLQIMLNPLGVPSRMNVGQILETHLGWAGAKLGFQAITPVFNGASEDEIHEVLEEAGLPQRGKIHLQDGRTGVRLEQETTVGYIYMLKLHHLVDDKVHARSTGPYSLITQQPLGGKARFGGQRFGEMEVWALEAYGAAYILQELLTVKSDDVEGRTKIYESMVKGENTLEAGTPASFDVLTNEIRGLALNMQLEKRPI